MNSRRHFLKGTAGAGAALSTTNICGWADMAPEPEKPKAWKGFAKFEKVSLTSNRCVTLVFGHRKRKFRVGSLHVRFEGVPTWDFGQGDTERYPPPKIEMKAADLSTAWPVDLRYGRSPALTQPSLDFEHAYYEPLVTRGPEPAIGVCVAQHMIRPHVPFDLDFSYVRIDAEHDFALCLIACTPLFASGKIGLEEILPALIDF